MNERISDTVRSITVVESIQLSFLSISTRFYLSNIACMQTGSKENKWLLSAVLEIGHFISDYFP